LTPAPNVGARKPHKAALAATAVFSHPVGGACRRWSSYCLLCDVFSFLL